MGAPSAARAAGRTEPAATLGQVHDLDPAARIRSVRTATASRGTLAPPSEPPAGPHPPPPAEERTAPAAVRPVRRQPGPSTRRLAVVGPDALALMVVIALVPEMGWVHLGAVTSAVLCFLVAGGTYQPRLSLSVFDDVPSLLVAGLVGAMATVLSSELAGRPVEEAPAIMAAVAVAGALLLARTATYSVIRLLRRRGAVQHCAVVLGTGLLGRELVENAQEHPEYGLWPAGFLSDRSSTGPLPLPAPVLGRYADLPDVVRELQVSQVLVALPDAELVVGAASPNAELRDALESCDRLRCEILYVPRFHEMHQRTREMDEVWGISLVRARRRPWRSASWRVKRLLDVVAAALALVVLAPLMLATALAVRSEVGRGVLFRQVRVGLDARPFVLLKFRSLRDPEPGSADAAAPVWSIAADPRVGPVGRFIRATSLDELPQLLNILRGDMSIVGPRPERPEFVEEFARRYPDYLARHRTPAGLTGWAQVHGLRGDTSIADRARFDNYYIRNWSLWLDLRILARTVSTVVFRQGS